MPASSVLSRNTIVGIKAETTEGTFNAPGAGDVVAVVDIPEYAPEIEKLDRNVIKGSLGVQKPLAGLHTGSINLKYELRAAGVTANVSDQPEAHELLKNAWGKYNAGTNATVAAGSTATVINVGVGEGATFAVGDMVMILGEVRAVRSIAADALTLNYALGAGAPAATTPVRAAHNYKPSSDGAYTHLSAALWFDAETSGVLVKAKGCKTETFTLADVEVGSIPHVEQSLSMLDFDEVSGQTSPASPVFEDQVPAVVIDGILAKEGVEIPVGTFEFEMANTISKEMDINAVGGIVRQFITGREITGSVDPLMDKSNVTLQDNWKNNDSFELFVVIGIKDAGGLFVQGTCTALWIRNAIITSNEREDQDGLIKHSLGFKAHESATGTGDDEAVLGFV